MTYKELLKKVLHLKKETGFGSERIAKGTSVSRYTVDQVLSKDGYEDNKVLCEIYTSLTGEKCSFSVAFKVGK